MKKFIGLIFVFLFSFVFCSCTADKIDENEAESLSQTEVESQTQSLVPLLASNKSKNIFLYGINPEGVILYVDGQGHYYDWKYSCENYEAPKIFTGLFDNNSVEDIAVVTHIDENIDDLHIISDSDFDADSVYHVDKSEFNSYISYSIEYFYDDVNKNIGFAVDGKNYVFDISESDEQLDFSTVYYDKNVSYRLDNGKIYVQIVPGVIGSSQQKDNAYAEISITINAELLFDGYNISLADFSVDGL